MQQTAALYSKLVTSLDGIVWEADGDTGEPTNWLVTTTTLFSGLVAITAPPVESNSAMDVDYFLLKSPGAPSITVDPDLCRRKPAPPPVDVCETLSISRNGAAVVIKWDGNCILQRSTDVKGPFEDLPGTPISPVTISPTSSTQFFYRLRGN